MRKIILVISLILFLSMPCLADRVLIRNSDGVPIEYQSGDAPLGILRGNNPQYLDSEVTEVYITSGDYAILYEEKINKPLKDARDIKEADEASVKATAKGKVLGFLGITESQFKDLKDALKD